MCCSNLSSTSAARSAAGLLACPALLPGRSVGRSGSVLATGSVSVVFTTNSVAVAFVAFAAGSAAVSFAASVTCFASALNSHGLGHVLLRSRDKLLVA